MANPDSTLEARFWSKVRKYEPNPCWEWVAATRHGYGVIGTGPRCTKLSIASRVAWEIAHGEPVPEGFCVLHRCDNPLCVRPSHLFLGTQADNSRDMVTKGRSKRILRPVRRVPVTDRDIKRDIEESF